MTIIDISVPLSPTTPVYPGDPPLSLSPLSTLAEHGFSLSELRCGTHTGTHIDPPRHVIEGGAGVAAVALDVLCGPARVVDVRGHRVVSADTLREMDLDGVTRVLLHTDSGQGLMEGRYEADHVHLDESAARYLVDEIGVLLVGIDTLSVDGASADTFPVHHALLGAGVVVVECLALAHADAGDYDLCCLPLRLEGGDGGPARAVLRR